MIVLEIVQPLLPKLALLGASSFGFHFSERFLNDALARAVWRGDV